MKSTLRGNRLVGVVCGGLLLGACGYGVTAEVTEVDDSAAILVGVAHSTQAGPVTYWFEYGETIAYGSSTPQASGEVANAGTGVPVEAEVTGLQAETEHHFRLCVRNGSARGGCSADRTFTTTAAAIPLTVTFVDVGKGDAAIYRGPCGEIGIIDVPRGHATTVANHIDPGAAVKWVAASHYHNDHMAGIDNFLPLRDVDVVHDRGGDRTAFNSDDYRKYYDLVTSVPGMRQPLAIGDTFSLCTGADAVTFSVISVGTDGTAVGGVRVTDENDRGLCFKVTHANFDMATCGDIGGGSGGLANVETPAAAAIGDVEFVKVNHHGSATSSNQAWVDTLDPAAVVLPVGPNTTGLPVASVVSRWAATGTIYRTDLDGDVTVTVNRNSDTFTVVSDAGTDSFPVDSDPPFSSVSVAGDNPEL